MEIFFIFYWLFLVFHVIKPLKNLSSIVSLMLICQIRELAEKESEDGVFKMLRSDVTRFLTTILIGTTYSSFLATTLICLGSIYFST